MNESYGNGKPPGTPSDEDSPEKKTLMRSMSEMVSGLSSSFIDWLYKNDDDNNEPRSSANNPNLNQPAPTTSRHNPPDNVRESLFGTREGPLDESSNWTRKRSYEQRGEGYGTSTPKDHVNRSEIMKNLTNQSTQQINPRSHPDLNIRPQTVIVSTPLSRERSVLVSESSASTTSTATYASDSYKYGTNSSQRVTPFYPGRTTYGGLATATHNVPTKRRRLSVTAMEGEDNNDNFVSQATQRICQVLESIQRPLLDTSIAPSPPSPFKLNSTSRSLKMSNNYIKEKYSHSNRYKPLYVNNNIKVNEYFAKLQGSTSKARQIIASLSSTVDQMHRPDSLHWFTKNSNTTVKDKKEANIKKEAEVQADISAPLVSKDEPDVVISITQEFTFSSPLNAPNAWVKCKNDNFSVTTRAAVIDDKTKPVVFKHVDSQTDVISISTKWRCDTCLIDNDDKVDKCVCCTASKPSASAQSTAAHIPIKVTSNPKEKGNKWRCDTCLIDNDDKVDKCVCCTASKPSASAQSTAAHIPIKVTSNPKEKGNKWRCNTCLVENDEKLEKCVCCTASKPSATGKQSLSQTTPAATIDLKVKTKKWRCETCLIENDDIVDKCVCCGGNKPSTSSQLPLKVTSEQKDKVKKWRCDTCLVENNDSVDICVCCGGNKNGSVEQSKPLEIQPSYKIQSEPDSVFKEIVKTQAARWECLSCFSRNESDKDKCICCETERPGSKKEPVAPKQFNFGTVPCGFKFGIPNNEVNINKQKEQVSDTNKDVAVKIPAPTSIEVAKTEAPKVVPTFSFGIPSTASATPTVNTQPASDTILKTNEISKTIAPAAPEPHKPEETKQPEPPPQLFIPTATITIAKPNNVNNTAEVKPFENIKFNNQLISNIAKTATETTMQLPIPSFTSATFTLPTSATNLQPPMTNSSTNVAVLATNLQPPMENSSTNVAALATNLQPPMVNSSTNVAALATNLQPPMANSSTNVAASATNLQPTMMNSSSTNIASIAPATNSLFELPKPALQTEPKPANTGFKFTFGAMKPNDEAGKAAASTSITSNPLSIGINPMSLMNQQASFSAPSEQSPFGSNTLMLVNAPATTNSFGMTQTSMFGSPTPNIFTANTQSNVTPSTTIMFGANVQSTAPPVTTSAFTFGVASNTQSNNAFEPMKSAPTFNIPNSTMFGGSNPANTNATPFGSAQNTSMFGSNTNTSTFLTFPAVNAPAAAPQFPTQQTLNNNLQTSSMFANNNTAQETKSPFGIASHTTFPLPTAPAQPAQNAFGFATNPPAPQMFGVVAPQPISGSGGFNFTLGQQPQQQSTPVVYNFGGAMPQFNMGSSTTPGIGAAGAATGTAGRRVRRAVRRTTPR